LSRRLILKVYRRRKSFTDIGIIAFTSPGIDDDVNRFGIKSAGDQVIHSPPVAVGKNPVKALAKGNSFEIRGHQPIDSLASPRPPHNKMTHVGDIEKSGGLTNGSRLLENRAEGKGKLIPMKICHTGTVAQVLRNKGKRQGRILPSWWGVLIREAGGKAP
jgi:hypothetical protein